MHQILTIPFGLVGGIRIGCCITSFNHPGSNRGEVSVRFSVLVCCLLVVRLGFFGFIFGMLCLFSVPHVLSLFFSFHCDGLPCFTWSLPTCPLNIYEKQMPTNCRKKVSCFWVWFLVMWPVKYGNLSLTLHGRCQRFNCGKVISSLVLNL